LPILRREGGDVPDAAAIWSLPLVIVAKTPNYSEQTGLSVPRGYWPRQARFQGCARVGRFA
jgi:hypothetical protein